MEGYDEIVLGADDVPIAEVGFLGVDGPDSDGDEDVGFGLVFFVLHGGLWMFLNLL